MTYHVLDLIRFADGEYGVQEMELIRLRAAQDRIGEMVMFANGEFGIQDMERGRLIALYRSDGEQITSERNLSWDFVRTLGTVIGDDEDEFWDLLISASELSVRVT